MASSRTFRLERDTLCPKTGPGTVRIANLLSSFDVVSELRTELEGFSRGLSTTTPKTESTVLSKICARRLLIRRQIQDGFRTIKRIGEDLCLEISRARMNLR